jgi:hypothetical protein
LRRGGDANGRLMVAAEWQHVVRRGLFPFLSQSNARQAAFGATLAILISYNACLALQLLSLQASESMGNHDSEIVGAGSVD